MGKSQRSTPTKGSEAATQPEPKPEVPELLHPEGEDQEVELRDGWDPADRTTHTV